MFSITYTESKEYQNELIKKAAIERLLKTASRTQKKHFSLRQIIQKLSSPQIRTSGAFEFDTL